MEISARHVNNNLRQMPVVNHEDEIENGEMATGGLPDNRYHGLGAS